MMAALLAAALAFTGCKQDPEEDPVYDPYAGLDWGAISNWEDIDDAYTLGVAVKDIDATSIRYKETALGNLIVDGIAAYAEHTSGKPVDFAMLNGQGAVLTTISKGDITTDQLTSMKDDGLYIVTYTGAQIKEIINIFVNSTSSGKWNANCAVLVSKGVSYRVDDDDNNATTPPKAVDIKVNGSPLSDEKSYRVAVGSFMATNTNFPVGASKETDYADELLETAVAKYIAAKGTVEPVVEGRITGEVPAL
jgi:2',3'-cyclic-nucleotide 2'-phosphodiesterase (5'-nucleotidase family)